MEREIIRLLLQHSFYIENIGAIDRRILPNELTELYDLIVVSHEKFKKDLTVGELKALYRVAHPTATWAKLDNINLILDNLPAEISEDVGKEIVKKAAITEAARELSEIGLDIINGKTANLEKARTLIERIAEGKLSEADDELEQVSDNLEEILEAVNITTKWNYNIPTLQTKAKGIGPGIFCGVFARVECGKTAYVISTAAGPGGFADQGALVHYYANEEKAIRTKARAVTSYTGIPYLELSLKLEEAKASYDKIKDNLKFFECRDKNVLDLEAHIKRHKPDIVIIDQIDKLNVNGSFAREDERLGELYIRFRDILAKNDCAGIGVSQASADAEGKTVLNSANMALARTSKPAELDVLIGIGKSGLMNENTRILNVLKDKVCGFHGEVVCQIIPELSRYVS